MPAAGGRLGSWLCYVSEPSEHWKAEKQALGLELLPPGWGCEGALKGLVSNQRVCRGLWGHFGSPL